MTLSIHEIIVAVSFGIIPVLTYLPSISVVSRTRAVSVQVCLAHSGCITGGQQRLDIFDVGSLCCVAYNGFTCAV